MEIQEAGISGTEGRSTRWQDIQYSKQGTTLGQTERSQKSPEINKGRLLGHNLGGLRSS